MPGGAPPDADYRSTARVLSTFVDTGAGRSREAVARKGKGMPDQINTYRIDKHSISSIAEGVLADLILFSTIISLTALMSLTGN